MQPPSPLVHGGKHQRSEALFHQTFSVVGNGVICLTQARLRIVEIFCVSLGCINNGESCLLAVVELLWAMVGSRHMACRPQRHSREASTIAENGLLSTQLDGCFRRHVLSPALCALIEQVQSILNCFVDHEW